jgi:hypothetical protein
LKHILKATVKPLVKVKAVAVTGLHRSQAKPTLGSIGLDTLLKSTRNEDRRKEQEAPCHATEGDA